MLKLALTFLVTQSVSHAQTVRSGTGAGATAARDLFRTDLGGGLVAGANGLFSDGTGARREINWDGTPNAQSSPNNLAPNFFNVNSPRGVVFSTTGSGFQVSDNAAGGNGGDEENSAYGRGGGRAAGVGEQAWVHGLMRAHGVQVFFYGHDHVFTDMVVDGIHYTLPGTTSAPWRFDGSETGYETYWTDSGHGRVQVTPERLRVEFVNSEGEILHAFDVRPGS